MDAFVNIVRVLAKRAETPKPFGLFHIVSIALLAALCAFIIIKRHLFNEKNVPYIILAVGIIMTLFEIYKQIVISFNPADGTFTYKWYIFPFQFCSTPIYITLLAFIFSRLKNKTVYGALCAFLSGYALIAGTVVFMFPSSVFNPIIGVNIQTVVHHGLMIALSICLLSSNTVPCEKRSCITAFLVFIPLLLIAMILNAWHGNGAEFDMFYIAPDSTFVLKGIRDFFNGFPPYPIYLIGYIALFTLGQALVFFITSKLRKWKKSKSRI